MKTMKMSIFFLINIIPCYYFLKAAIQEPKVLAQPILCALIAVLIRDYHINRIFLAFFFLTIAMTLLTIVSILNLFSSNGSLLIIRDPRAYGHRNIIHAVNSF